MIAGIYLTSCKTNLQLVRYLLNNYSIAYKKLTDFQLRGRESVRFCGLIGNIYSFIRCYI